jgi:hypothetical protein
VFVRAPAIVRSILQEPGTPLAPVAGSAGPPGFDFSRVRVHTDARAADAASAVGAAAFNAGEHIVFGVDRFQPSTAAGESLLRHELTHIVQRRGDLAIDTDRTGHQAVHESEADAGVLAVHGSPARGMLRSPESKVLNWAARWLERRGAKYVTKHIAKHTREIAGKAVHSIFKNPREIKYLLKGALREAGEIAARKGEKAAATVIEESVIKITKQQTSTPGKVRWVIQKAFGKAIGTEGERVLTIVLDQSGRIVTAYPAGRFLALGLGVAAVETLTAHTADAAETYNASVDREISLRTAANRAAEDDSSWEEWIPIIGDLWGGSLNVGEDRLLAAGREQEKREKVLAATVESVVADIEHELQKSLGPEERAQVAESVQATITSGAALTSELLEEENADTP